MHGSISISGGQLFVFKITFFILTSVAALWLVAVGAILSALRAFSINIGIAESVASGSIYMSILALSVIVNLAIIFPALLVLQPLRLWRVLREERQAITPRQRFRGKLFPVHFKCYTLLTLRISCLSTDIQPVFCHWSVHFGYRFCILVFFDLSYHWTCGNNSTWAYIDW